MITQKFHARGTDTRKISTEVKIEKERKTNGQDRPKGIAFVRDNQTESPGIREDAPCEYGDRAEDADRHGQADERPNARTTWKRKDDYHGLLA